MPSGNKKNVPSEHILFEYIRNHDNTKLEKVLKKSPQVDNVYDASGYTPLTLASKLGNEAAVSCLTKYKHNVNLKDGNGNYPLHYAAQLGCENILRILINHDADINAKGKNSQLALHFAIKSGRITIVKLLLDLGSDIMPDRKDRSSTSIFPDPLELAQQIESQVIYDLLKKELDRQSQAYNEAGFRRTRLSSQSSVLEGGWGENFNTDMMLLENEDLRTTVKRVAAATDETKQKLQQLEKGFLRHRKKSSQELEQMKQLQLCQIQYMDQLQKCMQGVGCKDSDDSEEEQCAESRHASNYGEKLRERSKQLYMPMSRKRMTSVNDATFENFCGTSPLQAQPERITRNSPIVHSTRQVLSTNDADRLNQELFPVVENPSQIILRPHSSPLESFSKRGPPQVDQLHMRKQEHRSPQVGQSHMGIQEHGPPQLDQSHTGKQDFRQSVNDGYNVKPNIAMFYDQSENHMHDFNQSNTLREAFEQHIPSRRNIHQTAQAPDRHSGYIDPVANIDHQEEFQQNGFNPRTSLRASFSRCYSVQQNDAGINKTTSEQIVIESEAGISKAASEQVLIERLDKTHIAKHHKKNAGNIPSSYISPANALDKYQNLKLVTSEQQPSNNSHGRKFESKEQRNDHRDRNQNGSEETKMKVLVGEETKVKEFVDDDSEAPGDIVELTESEELQEEQVRYTSSPPKTCQTKTERKDCLDSIDFNEKTNSKKIPPVLENFYAEIDDRKHDLSRALTEEEKTMIQKNFTSLQTQLLKISNLKAKMFQAALITATEVSSKEGQGLEDWVLNFLITKIYNGKLGDKLKLRDLLKSENMPDIPDCLDIK